MVRFEDGTQKTFNPNQCKGLKMGITTLEHHGLLDVDEDRIYNPMTADRLKEVPFLDGKAEDKRLSWMDNYNNALQFAISETTKEILKS